ncbi:MAG TPA: phosphatase PAP2 family protein [Puia sp.]|jgi:membrane-associated phospholipid phosphatase|nr:phosphatase PAP2 family protein [Puia sp.]
MKKISAIFSENIYFFIGYLLFLLICILLLSFYSKTDGFIDLNPYHTKSLDWFFIVYTNLGDGLFSIAIFFVLLRLRRPLAGWEIVFAFLLSGLVVQIVKNFFPMPRPKTLLGDAYYRYFIDGVTLVGNASFPSGHTATAFGTAALLSIFSKNKKYSLLYLFAASLVAYSRIYLGQHFLQDVLAGALIGVPVALVVYLVFDNNPSWVRILQFRKAGKM